MSVEYPIRAVAKLTGLSVDTLRAWERRYEAVVPERKGRGRAYSEEDVQRLLRLRQAVDLGHSIGQIANLPDDELTELLAGSAAPAAPRRSVSSDFDPQAAPILDAVARFDFVGVERELFRLATLLPARDLVHQVVLPLMRTVGERWHKGELSVSQEHMASAITRNLLGSVMRMHQPDAHASRILIATPAGELHEFGILAAATLAVSMRIEVTYLGSSLPGREIIDAAMRTESDAVLIGVSNPEPAPEVIDEVHLVIRGLAPEIPLWVGGADPARIVEGAEREKLIAIADFESLEDRLREIA